MPPPNDKQGVQRFCGMANYLNSFCPNLSPTIKPLFELTQNGHEFIWSTTHQTAFDKAKHLIANAPCLAYFCAHKPTTLQVDASQGGLGAALLQPDQDGKLQPVAYSSCKMRPNEEKWAQIEKECLAIVAACDKWDLWIYGQDVTIHTDHQPLETIFKKPLRSAPRRLQKMMLRLQRYRLKVIYKKGSSLWLADTLSRATLPTTNTSPHTNFEVFRLNIEEDNSTPGLKSQTLAEIKEATANDQTMADLINTITCGWPDRKCELPPHLTPFWTYRDELTVCDGVVFKGLQVLIPQSMQKPILQRIHSAHLGAASNVRMCKDLVFWPGFRADIAAMCESCGKCAQHKSQNSRSPMLSQPIPEYPWQFVSQDICTFGGNNYLVTVDHYSDFIEMDELDDTLANTIVKRTEAHVARHGVPEAILTDNGPQFIATEYENFCYRYKIQHITSSPYWPQGNGKAESSVKVLKKMLQKAGDNIQEALLNYRNTPQEGHTLSPAQRSMGRRTRGLLPISKHLLIPDHESSIKVQQSIASKRAASKVQYDKRCGPEQPSIRPGEFVYVKPPPHNRGKPWQYGIVSNTPLPTQVLHCTHPSWSHAPQQNTCTTSCPSSTRIADPQSVGEIHGWRGPGHRGHWTNQGALWHNR